MRLIVKCPALPGILFCILANKFTSMQVNIPGGYQQVMPYLIVNNAAGFIAFMQDVFGAEERMRHMRSEDVIMHAELAVGSCVIMLADATDAIGVRAGGFFIYVADADATWQKALDAGATAISPMADQPYGRSGGVADPYGNTWWVTTDKS
jgi:uncharacterized glyoxalase superfamily protein PhnB